MCSLFADTHNMVAILEKSDAAEGFKQIIDFLSRSYIHYALTVNPHIYISCIKQFWNIASVKRSDDVTRLQALVDRKKIVITEDVIHEILQLDDAESVSLSAKRTSWNEFSTAMASAMICLSKGQKFNFSKYIFDSLNQVGDLSTHTTRFISLSLTQKVFANMRRVVKAFSGVETPLFEGMLIARQLAEEGITEEQVQANDAAVQENVAEDVTNDAIPSPPSSPQEQSSPPQQPQSSPQAPPQAAQKLEIIKLKARVKRLEKANKVKSSKLRRLRKVGASKRVESSDDMEDAEIYHLDLDHSSNVLIMQEDDSEVQEVVEVVTTAKLITDVVTAASQVSAASVTISAAKPSIPAAALTVVAAYIRRRKGVIIRDPEEELSLKTPDETLKLKDKGKGILIETPKPMKKKDQIELDAEYARKLHEEINKNHEEINKDIDWDAAIVHNIAGYKMDFFKGMSYAEICPIFQARFDANMRFLFKSREEIEEEDQEIIKSINETPAQKAAKRRKLNEEAQEAEDLKKRLEVVDDEDDDVFIDFTPFAKKVPVVDYEIVLINNKPRFKIIKADETHQLYISFITLLKNFDREDLENLWGIVKERFSTSKPTNFSGEYLLLTLKTMFEKPDGQDAVWKNQRSVHGLALVKSWKLLTSCGVHIIALSTVQLILLVERRYPLSRFTLEQLMNITRLQVKEESVMSLELLSVNLESGYLLSTKIMS
nr:hypothetical protein [Tanacetum cinerariifolium]